MEQLTIAITTDNAAFEDDPGAEAARILRELADTLEGDVEPTGTYRLRDAYGNTVGRAVAD